MKAYAVVQEIVEDDVTFARYREQVLPIVTAHGGRFLVRGGNLTIVVGKWPYPRLVIIEFPSRAAAEGFYAAPEYQKVLPLRLKSAKSNFVIVDGPP